ncbi:hypothetical protein HF521_021437 [Silurus meridionalis]|uniref:Uncharacterized protein n=1 Tax=Silurus meridionalis TaxID=175797 RepID=A0A8T0BBF9_SILME|nr:hypothetical protein HF521_021437 [Silurus meridionalis]
MGLFGKTPEKPPKDLINEWSLKIRKEIRVIDRQIRDIQREEEKVNDPLKMPQRRDKRTCASFLPKR